MQSTNAGAALEPGDATQAPRPAPGDVRRRTIAGRWKMLAVLLVFAAPVIASYLTYYVIRPEGRTNYGDLVEPLRDVGALGTVVARVGAPVGADAGAPVGADAGAPVGAAAPAAGATTGDARTASTGGIASLHGRWVMLVVAPGACDAGCRERLYEVRQVRLTTGKDRDRVERAWIVEDDAAPDPSLLAQHDGLVLMRADAGSVARHLPATPATRASDHVYLIDPLGNLMMRFPKDADPSRMKKDLAKLLRASRVG